MVKGFSSIIPDLDKKYFEGECDLAAEKVRKLTTTGNEETVKETLTKLGWEGQSIATVTLTVSTDGKRAEDGRFNLRGPLTEDPIKLQASKLWEKVDERVVLEITIPQGEKFQFEGGRLFSEFLDQQQTKYRIVKEGRILTEAKKKENGVGDFCLQVITHLSKTAKGQTDPASSTRY